MTKLSERHARWLKHPEYRREYEALEEEFASIAMPRVKTEPKISLEASKTKRTAQR